MIVESRLEPQLPALPPPARSARRPPRDDGPRRPPVPLDPTYGCVDWYEYEPARRDRALPRAAESKRAGAR